MTEDAQTISFRRIGIAVSYVGLIMALPLVAHWYHVPDTPISVLMLPGLCAAALLFSVAIRLVLRRFALVLERWPRLVVSDVFNVVFVVALSLWAGLEFGGIVAEFGGMAAMLSASFLTGFAVTPSIPIARGPGCLPYLLLPGAMLLMYLPFAVFCVLQPWIVYYDTPLAGYVFRMQAFILEYEEVVLPSALAFAVGGVIRPWKNLTSRRRRLVAGAISYAIVFSLMDLRTGLARDLFEMSIDPQKLLLGYGMIVLGTLTLPPFWSRGLYVSLVGLIVYWEFSLYTFF